MRLFHGFAPVFDENSKILILGSFPSVKSRENAFYYGHPRNRFWPVLAAVFGADTPQSIEEKRRFLLSRGVALWDVVQSCEIDASSDASIRGVTPNDISPLLAACDIRAIFANGRTAQTLYRRFLLPRTGRDILALPSTSPANAAFSPDRLVAAWRAILLD